MGRVLVDNVHVDGVMYAVGSTPTDPDVVARIGDHCWREEEAGPGVGPAEVLPAPKQSFAVEEVGPSIFAKTEVVDEVDPPAVKLAVGSPPNKGGKNSSVALWLAYAEANGVAVHAAAERHEVLAALKAANVPTE